MIWRLRKQHTFRYVWNSIIECVSFFCANGFKCYETAVHSFIHFVKSKGNKKKEKITKHFHLSNAYHFCDNGCNIILIIRFIFITMRMAISHLPFCNVFFWRCEINIKKATTRMKCVNKPITFLCVCLLAEIDKGEESPLGGLCATICRIHCVQNVYCKDRGGEVR